MNILADPAVGQDTNDTSVPGYTILEESIADAIQLETENLQKLKNQLKELQDTNQAVTTEINAYTVQISTYDNLLLLPNTDIRHLDRARSDNHIAIKNVEPRIKNLEQKLASIRTEQEQTEAQIQLVKNQLGSPKENNQENRDAIADLMQLLKVLTAKQDSLEEAQVIYQVVINQFESISGALESLAIKFEQKIVQRKKQFLLSRTHSPSDLFNKGEFLTELQIFKARIKKLSLKETWLKELRTDWKSGQPLLLSFFLIYCIVQFLLMKLNRYLKRYVDQEKMNETTYQHITLRIIRQSLYLLGITGFGYIYSSLSGLYGNISVIRLVILILTVFLFTRWGHSFLNLWLGGRTWLKQRPVSLLHNLIGFICYFSIVYLGIAWILDTHGLLLLLARFLLESYLLIWLIMFWKAYTKNIKNPENKPPKLTSFLSFMSYGIVVSGVVVEILGYGGLAAFWYASWGTSLIVILWSSLILLVLQECRQTFKAQLNEQENEYPKPVFLFRWTMLQLGWIIWLITSGMLLAITWGGKRAIILNFLNALTKEIKLGNISISLMNLLYALLILILTQAIARFWRYFLKEKILSESGMNIGLQNSITMISVYSLWAFGILFSLHVFGFGTTSLAVGFGALGIGLGFGLQNIFNNFISGIILLIERPIMVGDDVEVNGTWALVKKINVRSTVVQTYDNATLIIPNSEFISQQVKNWSFKDKRLRVKIDIGVAYGSDIELVRETLLEIASQTHKVFENPHPDVIFRDFGDSALIFRLRVWTDIDNMFKVETAIRFDIDRLFKERNIVIAFPQRDVHLFQTDISTAK
jgi:small-conductance mechanosensitive channel